MPCLTPTAFTGDHAKNSPYHGADCPRPGGGKAYEPAGDPCQPRINNVGPGAINVSRRPQPESLMVGQAGCSMASRPLHECELLQVS